MRTITTEELKEANRKAYAEQRLSVQQGKGCFYKVNGCGCAIGVALNADEIQQIIDQDVNGQGIGSIITRDIVDFEDVLFAMRLQELHDRWTSFTRDVPYWGIHEAQYKRMVGIA